MKKLVPYVGLFMLLVCRRGQGACDPSSYQINGCDRFTLSSSDHALHVLGAAGSVLIVHQLLRTVTSCTKLEGLLGSMLFSYIAWSAKEFYHDSFASDGNNTGNLLGIGLGGLIVIPLGR